MGAAAMRAASGSRSISIWSLVLALTVIAFWRTIAPERSARTIQRFFNQRESYRVSYNETEAQFGELKRLRASIRREKKALLALREEIKKLNVSASEFNAEGPTALGASIKRRSEAVERERKEIEPTEQMENSIDEQEDEALATECNMILAPIAAEAGLGTQTEHLWKHLTLAKSLNSCVALPPIVARTTADTRYVPIHEVIDMGPLVDIIKLVPLSTCKKRGVGALIGDGITSEAFDRYLKNSDPVLAAESSLVSNVSTITEFSQEGDLSEQESIVKKSDSFCVGTGKMSSVIEFDDEVLDSFNSATRISEYVTDRFRDIEHNLFVRLRWRKGACENTPENEICLGDSSTVSMSDYVAAIKEKAKNIEAKSIYISFPPSVPLEVMKYLTENIRTIDNVMLLLEGDEFAANVIEREIALRSKAFVDDGGVWGSTIQSKRKLRSSETYEENASSSDLMNQWSEGGKNSNNDIFIPDHILEKKEQEEIEVSQPEEPQPEVTTDEKIGDTNENSETEESNKSTEGISEPSEPENLEVPVPENIVNNENEDENRNDQDNETLSNQAAEQETAPFVGDERQEEDLQGQPENENGLQEVSQE